MTSAQHRTRVATADGGSGSTEAAVDSELDPDESGAESDDEHHSE